jgi:hypothetical protein
MEGQMSESQTEEGERLLEHRPGTLKPDQLNDRIQEVWSEALATEAGRQHVAAVLGVSPQDLKNGPPPIEVVRASGFVDPTLLIVVKWTLTTIVVPALIGVAKEEAKDRLTRLWKEVLLPAIRGKKEDAIN